MNKDVMGVQEVSPGYEFVAENPAVPVGYKQTEVGVIPEDWGAVQLRDIGIVIRGASPRPKGDKRFYGGGIPRLMVEDVTRDGKYVTPKVDFLTTEGAMRSRPCKAGTLTLVCSGTVGVPAILKVDACIHDGFLALVNLKDTVNVEYLYYQFEMLRALFDSSATHGGVFTNLTTTGVKEFRVAIPSSPEEQRAIATALSDVDALLEELDRLIAKKRDIKQAAMQQLLTGETRLPGFEGEWETVLLGDVAAFYKGKGLPKSAINTFGEQPCIHYGELFTQYGVKIEKTISRTDECFDSFLSVANDVLMPTSDVTPSGLAKASCVSTDNVVLGGDILVIRTDPDRVNGVFLSSIIRKDADQVLRLVTGTTVYHLYGSDMQKFIFAIPSVAEQNAIVDTFADMDTEIQALEQRRSKTAELKQGMMQELLTGRTRLV
jgi:type I restriction enzyme S subunit